MKPRVLCVDDEPNVLEALNITLRRGYEVVAAPDGKKALEILERDSAIDAVISDMRMPIMDGVTFLTRAFELRPDVTRILLTGHADLDSAAKAVNHGRIHHFLTKPCLPADLLSTLADACEMTRLRAAERILLEQTLRGSIKALVDMLSLMNPIGFGRATRIKTTAVSMAEKLGISDRWQLEVAAMLSQLGFVTLPHEVVERLYFGQPLTEPEQAMVAKVPAATEQVIAHIPRLEGVRAILAGAQGPRRPARADAADKDKQELERAADILRIALEVDLLETRGSTMPQVVEAMRAKPELYDDSLVTLLAELRGHDKRNEIVGIPIAGLKAGMVFADDVRLSSGALLVARGYEVTGSFLARAKNFKPGIIKEPLHVVAASIPNPNLS